MEIETVGRRVDDPTTGRTATSERCPGAWFHLGAPNLTDLRAFRTNGGPFTGAELLLYVKADLQLCDENVVILDEPRFKVAVLAHDLTAWVGNGTEPDRDFEHRWTTSESPNILRVTRTDDGWKAASTLVAETTGAHSWETVRGSIDIFVTHVHMLTARSLLTTGFSLIETMAALCRGFGLRVAESRSIVLPVSGREREFWAFQEQVWDALESLADKHLEDSPAPV